MTNYGQLYNERITKDAARYSQGAQARTYRDYMQNIQSQKQAAGQTFANLANQQANQSFYDMASGTPPGLSGGMQQQYTNARNAQSNAALGQVAQQRYQAFSDIAAQEAQASQFEQAQRLQEQQLQMGDMQLNQQRYAQAEQIMSSGNLTEQQKLTQLEGLGFTRGEINRMNETPSAGPIIGGATTIGATVGIPKLYTAYTTSKENLTAVNEILGTNVAEYQQNIQRAIEPLKKEKTALEAIEATQRTEVQNSRLSEITEEIADKNNKIKNARKDMLDTITGGSKGDAALDSAAENFQRQTGERLTPELGETRQAAEAAQTKFNEATTQQTAKQQAYEAAQTQQTDAIAKRATADKELKDLKSQANKKANKGKGLKDYTQRVKDAQKTFDQADEAAKAAEKAVNTTKGAVDDAVKVVESAKTAATQTADDAAAAVAQFGKKTGEKVAKMGKVLKTSQVAADGTLKKVSLARGALGKAGSLAMKGIAAYFIADSIAMIITGKGIIGNVQSLLDGKGFAKGGIVGLASR